MKMLKQLCTIAVLLVSLLSLGSLVAAYDGTIVKSIEINNQPVYTSQSLGGASDFRVNKLEVAKGELLDIDIRLEAPTNENIQNVELLAKIVHEYSNVLQTYDSTSLFDIDNGDTVFKNLQIRVPKDTDEQVLDLHILIIDRQNVYTQDIQLHIKGKRHDIAITRVLFTPENIVKAGSFLIGKVRVENFGDNDEDDILVRAWVEGLEGASDSDVISDVRGPEVTRRGDLKGEALTSEELYLPIPLCAKPGRYPVVVEVLYDNDRGSDLAEWEIMVEESGSEVCTRPSLTDAPVREAVIGGVDAALRVQAGGSVGVPVSVTNTGKVGKTYVLGGDATGWGTVRYDPSNVLAAQPGQTVTGYVFADVAKDSMGTKWLNVNVRSGTDVVTTAAVQVDIDGEAAASSDISIRKTLEVILIVLVVLIVILGLIVGFNRLRGDDEDEDDEGKTYY